MKIRFATAMYLAAWFAMLAAVGCAPPPSFQPQQRADDDARAIGADVTAVKAVATGGENAKGPVQEANAQPGDSQGDSTAAENIRWGTIRGRFKFVGNAPRMEQIYPTKDGHVCGAKEPMFQEHLVVGKDGELANVVVYAMSGPDAWKTAISPIHPSYDSLKESEALLDNVNCRFEPHVLIGWTEQKFHFRNSDAGIGHNVTANPYNNRAISPLIPSGPHIVVEFSKPERIPCQATCSIHPWMNAYLLVRPDPYYAVSAKDGSFRIGHLPARDLAFQLWHESLGYLTTLSAGGEAIDGKKGVHAFTVKPGENDLGTLAIDAKDYAKQLSRSN